MLMIFSQTENSDMVFPQVDWGVNSTHIDIQLSYPSLGWIAMGLSPNGGMDQSDVLFGYVEDETGRVIAQVIVGGEKASI